MSAREMLGIAVEPDVIRVACMRGEELVWTLESDVEGDATLGEALTTLLARAPAQARAPRRAVVAIGSPLVQIRRLDGFPATETAAVRERILAEGIRRWFLLRTGGLLAAGPVAAPDGASWGAAYERSAIDEIRAATAASGVMVLQLVPSEVLLASTPLERIGTSNAVVPADATSPDSDSRHVAEAIAAARLGLRGEIAPLALVTESSPADAISRTRARVAISVAAIAAVSMLLAYPASLWRTHARLTRETASVNASLEADAVRATELARTSEALDAVARRRATRVSWITPIAELSQALPPGTAAVTLRADSTKGVVVLLGPRAGAAVDQLDAIRSLVSPVLLGPVTSEVVAGELMERATISFTIRFTIGFTLGARTGGTP